MSGLKVLSVASEVFPLIKTGGLADVVGALPAALAREGVEIRTLVPGYPAVMAKLADAQPAYAYDDLFGGPARILGGGRPVSTCSRSTRPISTTGPAIRISGPTGLTGLTMRRGSRRSLGSAPTSASARSTRSGLRSFTRTTGRRRSQPPISTTRTAATWRRHHDPQYGLPGPLSDVDLRRAGLAATGPFHRRRRVLRRRRLPQRRA